jgi:hypothetical protein
VVGGCRLIDKSNKDIREDIRISYLHTLIKQYRVTWLQHLSMMEGDKIPHGYYIITPKDEFQTVYPKNERTISTSINMKQKEVDRPTP